MLLRGRFSSSEISAKKLRLRILDICRSCCESILCFSNMRYMVMRVQPSLFASHVTLLSCSCSSSLILSPILIILIIGVLIEVPKIQQLIVSALKKDVGFSTVCLSQSSGLRIASTQRISNAVSPRHNISYNIQCLRLFPYATEWI